MNEMKAALPQSAVMMLFEDWKSVNKFVIETHPREEDMPRILEVQEGIAKRMCEIPSTCIRDWVAKVYALSERGDCGGALDRHQPLWAEAETFLKGGVQ